jgi:hypothetical protein
MSRAFLIVSAFLIAALSHQGNIRSKLINGKMQGVDKPTACGDSPIEEVSCPASVTSPRKQRPRAKR